MPIAAAVPRVLPSRRRFGLIAALGAVLALAAPALAGAAGPKGAAAAVPKPAVLTFKMAQVGSPGNPSVGIVPFSPGFYGSCAEAPAEPKIGGKLPDPCQTVGGVPYEYGIGELEVTVKQYVGFLNTVDPFGRNTHKLYSEDESGAAWPRFGQINFAAGAKPGHHYTAAAPEWLDKPYAFADFLRSARFDNSLANGKVLSRRRSSSNGFNYVTYKVRLSPRTDTGMYDMRTRAPERSRKSGFVIPSQNEWIKAAYYDPISGEYWEYPTGPEAPGPTTLDPTTGNVTNATEKPVATYHASETAAPYWCPSNQTKEACETVNPLGLKPTGYAKAFQGSVGTVGTARSFSPWGTLDQGGNAVEWTDTITPPPFGVKGHRVWRRLHGGIANAPLYQLWISAVGLQPQDNAFYVATYPWLGIRVGVIGALAGQVGR